MLTHRSGSIPAKYTKRSDGVSEDEKTQFRNHVIHYLAVIPAVSLCISVLYWFGYMSFFDRHMLVVFTIQDFLSSAASLIPISIVFALLPAVGGAINGLIHRNSSPPKNPDRMRKIFLVGGFICSIIMLIIVYIFAKDYIVYSVIFVVVFGALLELSNLYKASLVGGSAVTWGGVLVVAAALCWIRGYSDAERQFEGELDYRLVLADGRMIEMSLVMPIVHGLMYLDGNRNLRVSTWDKVISFTKVVRHSARD